MISYQTRRQKSREVYLSPILPPPSPNHNCNSNSPKHKHKHKHTGFIRGLWPSSTSTTHSSNENPPSITTTLADHLGVKRSGNSNSPRIGKQKSCTEFRNTSYTRNNLNDSGLNYTGKPMFPGRSSISSSTSKASDFFDSNQVILPGRLSVDENALRRSSSSDQKRSDSFSDFLESGDLGSPFTTARNSPASYMAPTFSSRKSAIEVSSKYMIPMHNSPKKATLKTAMRRSNSVSSSEWESSPSRLGSPSASFLSSKPPSSSRGKRNLLHKGLDLIKGKKGGSKLGSSSGMDTGKDMRESVHQLRLLQNSLMLWRFANARAEAVHEDLAARCENNLLYAKESMAKLQHSVVRKRLQLQKEKLEMKLNLILHSQTNMLEAWEDIERRHIVDVSIMKDYLHAVVCMVPLTEGAKVDLESTSSMFQHTSHLVATIKSTLSSVSPMAHKTIFTLSELAEIVSHEKLLLDECFDHLRVISTLEIQERNLRCNIIAMGSMNEQEQQQYIQC